MDQAPKVSALFLRDDPAPFFIVDQGNVERSSLAYLLSTRVVLRSKYSSLAIYSRVTSTRESLLTRTDFLSRFVCIVEVHRLAGVSSVPSHTHEARIA
jgi:hypothetical protein